MLLSICIPTTDGRAAVLDGTLKSILDSNIAPNSYTYEVVISDNSHKGEAYDVARKYLTLGLNVKYYKSKERTFYNIIESLKLSRGAFIKLHNDYSIFNRGELLKMLEFVDKHNITKEQILFTNGELDFNGYQRFTNFNDFIKKSSYWHTWASGFSIWRNDFEKLDCSKDNLDPNFPHVSLLFANNNKKDFIINNSAIFTGQFVKGKGGYNIFKLFCVDYPDMLVGLINRGLITQKTYRAILVDLRNDFIPLWLSASVYSSNGLTFDNAGYEENLKHVYGRFDLALIKAISVKHYLRSYIKRLFKQ
ncbi:glycosyltransferase [Aeromonas jandaei]|uniref:glycosyltransferase n=1 Tax=Aeromonas jandaei TaxID=650 RepID=UPI000F5349F0|nr:glycosyltransferase [Aeromonas jandaei]RQM70163.1 glycosyltransferase [Aeromonas jandaei]